MDRKELEKLLVNEISLDERIIIIWGTGNTAELYQEGLQRLTNQGDFDIAGYGDNDPIKQGKTFHEKKVYSAEQIAQMKNVLVLIASPQKKVSDAVSSQLNALGIENYLLDKVIFSKHKEEILRVYDLLSDEKSKDTYAHIVSCRMTNEEVGEEFVAPGQYFCIPTLLKRNPKEVFLECGGYVGDTIEQYLWKRDGTFSKIISFEPDVHNYAAMKCRVERLIKEWNLREDDIELYPYGVGAEDIKMFVTAYDTNHGLGSKLQNEKRVDAIETKIVKLDSVIKDEVGFLKADIESYEYGMLMGAKRMIQENMPKLAICIYHNAADFFQIPLLIHEMNPDYKFAVRHHSYDLDDTVLYAWI